VKGGRASVEVSIGSTTFVKHRPVGAIAIFSLHSRQIQLFVQAYQLFMAPSPITTTSVEESKAVLN
jgi:hypothetical protein